MVKYENECCSCAVPAYPCLGSDCPNRNVPHYYCDECGDETQLYEWGGQELCIDCLEKYLDKVN
jgi:hypothetical protein